MYGTDREVAISAATSVLVSGTDLRVRPFGVPIFPCEPAVHRQVAVRKIDVLASAQLAALADAQAGSPVGSSFFGGFSPSFSVEGGGEDRSELALERAHRRRMPSTIVQAR